MGWFSSFTDSISHAIGTDGSGSTPLDTVSGWLGTDGSNSGLLPGLSNALGTDGSKNGLLNDPLSMAAAAAAAVYFSGGAAGGLSAATGGGAVSSGAGALGAASGYATSAAIADTGLTLAAGSGIGAVASPAWALPSWLTTGNVLNGLSAASTASKFLGGSAAPTTRGAQPMYGPSYFGGGQPMAYGNLATRPMNSNAQAPRPAPGQTTQAGTVSPMMGLLIAAGIFYIVNQK